MCVGGGVPGGQVVGRCYRHGGRSCQYGGEILGWGRGSDYWGRDLQCGEGFLVGGCLYGERGSQVGEGFQCRSICPEGGSEAKSCSWKVEMVLGWECLLTPLRPTQSCPLSPEHEALSCPLLLTLLENQDQPQMAWRTMPTSSKYRITRNSLL